jgi:hypothetical protein
MHMCGRVDVYGFTFGQGYYFKKYVGPAKVCVYLVYIVVCPTDDARRRCQPTLLPGHRTSARTRHGAGSTGSRCCELGLLYALPCVCELPRCRVTHRSAVVTVARRAGEEKGGSSARRPRSTTTATRGSERAPVSPGMFPRRRSTSPLSCEISTKVGVDGALRNECKGGFTTPKHIHRRLIAVVCLSVVLSTPMNVIWRCEPPFTTMFRVQR